MKKEFNTPICEVVEFENEDILTASSDDVNIETRPAG